MGVREQIMDLAIPDPLGESERQYNDALIQAADIAEARERELLAKLDASTESTELAVKRIGQLNAERAQMIAELRELPSYENPEGRGSRDIDYDQLQAIINKYEVKE